MSEIHEQFIESAVAGFGDNLERKFAAKAWLADTVVEADDNVLGDAIDRWRWIDGKGRAWWRSERILLIAWVALCALLLFPFFLMIRETKDIESLFMQKIVPGPARDEEQWVPVYAPENAKAFLLTGEGLTTAQRSEALWRAEPGVPGYYAQYLVMNHTRGLPADFWAISSKLDPGNVWFDQYAAGVLATNAAARVKIPYSSMADKRSEWAIKDPARLEEAYGILKKSAGKTRYDSYSGARFRERFATFRSPRTMHEKLAQLVLLTDFGFQGERQTSGLGGLLSARAWIYAEAGDTAGFSELLEVHSRVVEQRLAAQEVNYMQEMVTRALITATARDFSYAAEKLLFPQEAAKFARIADIDEASRKTPRHHTIDPSLRSWWDGGFQLGGRWGIQNRASHTGI